jgi:23S rRNA (guanosine2251-2'-O)-methyltransferase
MAGNSQRRGAIRKGSSKKGATVGSGGQRRRGLEGKGPTPKAADRPNHKAHKMAKAAAKRGGAGAGRPGAGRPSGGRRSKGSSEIVAGRNSVVEALRANVPVTTMYVAGRIDADDRVREALKTATERGIPILETPRGELDRLTDGAVHQGLALQVPPYEYAHPSDLIDPETPGIPLVVALDGITDPRNLGAIIRSVAAFGGHGVVVPERRSVGMTASAWKTSAGAAARVPVALASNLTRSLEDFRKAGFFILGLDMDGDVGLPELELATEPLVVVVGSEGKGLSRLVGETCDQIVSIPMSSAVESLNAGIATGVTLYEIARRRAAGGTRS